MSLSQVVIRCSGPLACFTRPELKAERVSYPVITPSAAKGILEAILWKPAIRWRVDRVRVLAPIRWIAFRRNELGSCAVIPSSALIRDGGAVPTTFIEADRAQRNTVALRDVDYVVEAHFELTERAGHDDNPAKFADMFRRRVERGQHFHQPYLGCREFAADVEPVDDETPEPIDDSRDLGLMLWDIDFSGDRNRPLFFAAELVQGVLEIPSEPIGDATREGNL
jgi:CRISPR-associated protein Cas5d